ncbi:MAG: DUF4349 domain-containing protein [Myxococcota bacterium]
MDHSIARPLCAFFSLLLVVGAVTGCLAADREPAPASQAPVAPTVASDESAAADAAPADAPKLIQTAYLSLRVKHYEACKDHLVAELDALEGRIVHAEVTHGEGRVDRASLEVDVPAGRLRSFLSSMAEEGTVLAERVEAKDVTEAHVDLTARRKNAARLEARLLTLLEKRGDSVSNLLSVERELARVREAIERYDAQLRTMDSRISMSRVELHLQVEGPVSAMTPPSLATEAKATWTQSWQNLRSFSEQLLLFGIALVPWMPLVVITGFGLRRLRRFGRTWRQQRLSS